jgi:hypothetical protein
MKSAIVRRALEVSRTVSRYSGAKVAQSSVP